MNSREIASEYRLAKWAQALKEHAVSGESINEFCENRGVSRNTYFYWQRKLREAACVQLQKANALPMQLHAPAFAEVKMVESLESMERSEEYQQSQLRLEVSGINITADSAYPMEKLAILLRELTRS